MAKPNLGKILKRTRQSLSKHSPEILTGIGIAGMITTTVLAVRATPKALALIEEEMVDKGVYELTPVETVKTAWKPYIPAIVTGVTSTACLIGASSVSARRTAALAAAYQLSETALTEYKEKVVETIGEKKEQLVRDKVAEDKLKKQPVSKSEVYVTNKGNTLFLDPISGRYFESDIERVKKAENNLNKQLLHDISGYVSLNDFYDEIELPHTSQGDDLGWSTDKGLLDMDFRAQIADDGRPCIVLDYRVAPRYDYDKFN